jgi:hypothetical protein
MHPLNIASVIACVAIALSGAYLTGNRGPEFPMLCAILIVLIDWRQRPFCRRQQNGAEEEESK